MRNLLLGFLVTLALVSPARAQSSTTPSAPASAPAAPPPAAKADPAQSQFTILISRRGEAPVEISNENGKTLNVALQLPSLKPYVSYDVWDYCGWYAGYGAVPYGGYAYGAPYNYGYQRGGYYNPGYGGYGYGGYASPAVTNVIVVNSSSGSSGSNWSRSGW